MLLNIRFTKSSDAREEMYPQNSEMARTSNSYTSVPTSIPTDSAKKYTDCTTPVISVLKK